MYKPSEMVEKEDKIGLGLAVAVQQPADRYEYHELKLSRAWKPSDSSGASPLGAGDEAHFCFFNGN